MMLEAIQSVHRQTYTDYEVIVVDDGSDDGTWEELKELGDRVCAVRQPRLGPGAARNNGLRQATGEYIAFLDSDDQWLPWTLETYDRALSIHPQPSHLIGRTIEYGDGARLAPPIVERSPELFAYHDDFLCTRGEDMAWATGLAVVRRALFEKGLRFDTDLRCYEDQDFALRIGCEPNFVIIRSPITIMIRLTPDSLSRAIGSAKFDGLMNIIERERAALYGGGSREHDRERYIALNVRTLSLWLITEGMREEAYRLYLVACPWNIGQKRWKYVLSFPILLFLPSIAARIRERHATRQSLTSEYEQSRQKVRLR
jgi:glycosyltransferase involved in cell wall biosynthesis